MDCSDDFDITPYPFKITVEEIEDRKQLEEYLGQGWSSSFGTILSTCEDGHQEHGGRVDLSSVNKNLTKKTSNATQSDEISLFRKAVQRSPVRRISAV